MKVAPVMDTIDQDVQALKEWLRKAWCYLAQPAHTRFDRGEMRQQMKLAEEKLRVVLRNAADRDTGRNLNLSTLMDKLGWAAMGILAAAFAADQYWNYGYYTDAAIGVFRQIGHSFGW